MYCFDYPPIFLTVISTLNLHNFFLREWSDFLCLIFNAYSLTFLTYIYNKKDNVTDVAVRVMILYKFVLN